MVRTTYISWVIVVAWIATFISVPSAIALNKINNWNFTTNSTGWTATNSNGTNVCGNTGSATSDDAMATAPSYDGTSGNPAGSLRAVTVATKNRESRAMATQTVVAPGGDNVLVKGKFDYFASSAAGNWGPTNSSWIRVDLYDSNNTTHVAELGCVSFNSAQAWTSTAFGSEATVTGGTTYTVRITFRGAVGSSAGAKTLRIDNVHISFAPVGLSGNPTAGTTNASLGWTASTAGTGANGLHASTPYKVYRHTASPVTTSHFLANSTTNSYSDTSTAGNTTYYYALSDVDTASNESPLSSEVSVLTLPAAPGTPTFSNVDTTTLTVNWSTPTGDAISYKLERCSGSGCSDFSEIASGINGGSYDDTGLSSSTVYRYRVRATNASGDSSYSATGETTTATDTIISVSITSDGVVAYGIVPPNTSKSTIAADLADTQVAKNDGNVAETFNIKTSAATGGTTWNVGTTTAADTFIHAFSVNNGSDWTTMSTADSYQTLISNVAANASQNFDLRLTTPTSSSDYQQKTITITIQAVQF